MIEMLDPEQRAAAQAGAGLVVIKAGAGTGKTRVLTARIAHLIADMEEEPASILATTFTRKAAQEMLERATQMGNNRVAAVQIRTVDAVAVRILRRQWSAAGLHGPNFVIADPDEADALLAEILIRRGLLTEDMDWRAQRALTEELRTRIGRWKENGLRPFDLSLERRPRLGMADSDAADVYQEYDEALTRRHLVEFSDLSGLASAALQSDPAVLEAESGKIKWLLVDEAQDLNISQVRMLNLLSSHHGNLTIVGDDDQSLYSWRGAVPSLMENAATYFPASAAQRLVQVTLFRNRRCTDEILEVANRIVDHNERETPKELSSGRSGLPIEALSLSNDEQEAKWVANRIREIINEGSPPEEIAILGRTMNSLDAVAKRLAVMGIPYSFQAGQALWERTEIRDILAYIKLSLHPALDVALRRVIARPGRGLGPVALKAIIDRSREIDGTFYEAIENIVKEGGFRGEGREGALALAEHLRALHYATRDGVMNEDLVDYIIRDVGYGNWAFEQEDANPRTLSKSFEIFREISRSRVNLPDLAADVAVAGNPDGKSPEGVHLGTIHSSKGLEWDHVFLVAFEDGILPNQRVLEAEEAFPPNVGPEDPYRYIPHGGIAEERRLAHVALTRAKQSASITMAQARMIRGSTKFARPSRFAQEGDLTIQRLASDRQVQKPAQRAPYPGKILLKSQKRTMW